VLLGHRFSPTQSTCKNEDRCYILRRIKDTTPRDAANRRTIFFNESRFISREVYEGALDLLLLLDDRKSFETHQSALLVHRLSH
jgi:hypothetical protein